MSKLNKLSLSQQRELLNLKANSTRLKLIAKKLKMGENSPKSKFLQQSLALAEKIPMSSMALKLANKPKRWRNKILLGSLLMAFTLIKKSIVKKNDRDV